MKAAGAKIRVIEIGGQSKNQHITKGRRLLLYVYDTLGKDLKPAQPTTSPRRARTLPVGYIPIEDRQGKIERDHVNNQADEIRECRRPPNCHTSVRLSLQACKYTPPA